MKPVRLPPKVLQTIVFPKTTLATKKELLRLSTLCLTSSLNARTIAALGSLEKSYSTTVLEMICKNAQDSDVRQLAGKKRDNVLELLA